MFVLRSARRTARALLVVPTVVLVTATPSGAATPPVDELDQAPGSIRILSKRTDGTFGTEVSGEPSISGNGRYVAFYSEDTEAPRRARSRAARSTCATGRPGSPSSPA